MVGAEQRNHWQLLVMRRTIETRFSELCSLFDIEHTLTRSIRRLQLRIEQIILAYHWNKYFPSGFSNKSLEKVKWNVFPRDVSKVETKSLSMLYTDSSKYIFNRNFHKSFSKSLFDKDDLYCYKHR